MLLFTGGMRQRERMIEVRWSKFSQILARSQQFEIVLEGAAKPIKFTVVSSDHAAQCTGHQKSSKSEHYVRAQFGLRSTSART